MLGTKRGIAAIAAAAALTCAPAALASGGVNSGGVNSGGVNSGGGTSSGGGGGGGSTTTITPTPVSTTAPGSCAAIQSVGNTTGVYSIWAAIWSNYNITNDCTYGVTASMSYTNRNTGLTELTEYPSADPGNNSGTIDEDWAAFGTPYTVTLKLTDPYSGAVLATNTTFPTTPVQSTSGGGGGGGGGRNGTGA